MNIIKPLNIFLATTAVSYTLDEISKNFELPDWTKYISATTAATGHFISNELFIHGVIHEILDTGAVTITKAITKNFKPYHTDLFYIPKTFTNLLFPISSFINNKIEKLEKKVGVEIPYINEKVCVGLYLSSWVIDIYNYFQPNSTLFTNLKNSYIGQIGISFNEWRENAAKDTVIEKHYETIQNVWDFIHPWHHLSEVLEKLGHSNEIIDSIQKIGFSVRFYVNEMDEITDSFNYLMEKIIENVSPIAQDQECENNLIYFNLNQSCYLVGNGKNCTYTSNKFDIDYNGCYNSPMYFNSISRYETGYSNLLSQEDMIIDNPNLNNIGVILTHPEL